jgi:hypothetical protein
MERHRVPNWRKWKYCLEVPLWQAVALSLGIDPDKVRRASRSADLRKGKRFDEGEEFELRLRVNISVSWGKSTPSQRTF